jgi:4-amino-4-deoxy-L-arabinose transferase-like glycosyltransferase
MRAGLTRVPKAAWVCALVAFANALVWSLIVPLFQVPDEPAHVAYAQYVAESGKAPSGHNDRAPFSEEERNLVEVMRWKQVSRRSDNRPPVSAAGHQLLERTADRSLNRLGGGGFTSITNNPPLYYGLAAIAYRVTPSSSLADRIHAMRLLSTLLAAVTTLLVFGFLRELLPGTPWAWTIGALAVAFQPLFGFVSGGVNSDDLLFAAAAGVFYGLALAFRRGLTPGRGAFIGACAAIGLLAKINMVGLLPGVLLGLFLLIRRVPLGERRTAVRGALWAVGILAGAALVYAVLNEAVWDRGLFYGASGASIRGGPGIKGPGDVANVPSGGIGDALSYAWQFYLPRLPFMTEQFNNYPLHEVWFKGFVGIFGWLDYGFPRFVYTLALWIFVAVAALAARELISMRAAVRSRISELLTYAVILIGLLVLTNGSGYSARVGGAGGFEQARYLLPLLALYGAVVALAARGAGRRWGPAVGVLLVSIAIAHSAVAMLLTLTRYYG